MIKILMVGPGPGSPGGVRTVAENYIESYSDRNDISFDYVEIGTRGSMALRCVYFAAGLVKCFLKLLINNYDVCHIHMSDKGSVFRSGIVVLLARALGNRTLTHMHAGNLMLWYNGLSKAKQYIVARFLNASDKFVVLGDIWAKEVECIVSKEKIVVLHNGVKVPSSFQYQRKEPLTLLYLGVIKKQKGLRELIRAMSELDSVLSPEVKLLIAGAEFDMNIRAEIEKWDISRRVKYVGWADAEKKTALFERSSINVFPSYYEGLPMSLLETMAVGIPNIVTNVGALGEVVSSGINGLFIEPKDVESLKRAIVQLCSSEDEIKEMSLQSYVTIKEHFSLEKQIEETILLYRGLIAGE